MRRKLGHTQLGCELLNPMPDHLLCYALTPNSSRPRNASKQSSTSDPSRHDPFIGDLLDPVVSTYLIPLNRSRIEIPLEGGDGRVSTDHRQDCCSLSSAIVFSSNEQEGCIAPIQGLLEIARPLNAKLISGRQRSGSADVKI